LINKNLSFYCWLRKRIGKKWAYKVAITTESGILVFGRSKPRILKSEKKQETLDEACIKNLYLIS